MDYQAFKDTNRQIQRQKSILRRSRNTTRRMDSEKLLTIDILNDLAKKGGKFKYKYLGKDLESDPKKLKKARAKLTKNYNRKGITIQSLLKGTPNETISRSRLEIKTAHISQVKNNSRLIILTDKTGESKWRSAKHRCEVELKEYHDILNQDTGDLTYLTHAQAVIAGKVGVSCDCEDFQYRKNYSASLVGAYADEKDRETSFPKIRNPSLDKGLLCIHLVKALKVLMLPTSAKLLARAMAKEAKSITPGKVKNTTITQAEYDRMMQEQGGAEATDNVKNKWLDKESRKSYKAYKKARESFNKQSKDMITKKVAAAEKKAEAKYNKQMLDSAKNLLKNGVDKQIVSQSLGIDIKTIEKME